MRAYRILKLRLMTLFSRKQVDADLTTELEDHLEQEMAANLRSGMSQEEAREAALRQIGSLSLFADECRDARGTAVWDNLRRDLRFSLRMLRRTPFFTTVAILTLGLGIGANTGIFTLVNSLLFRKLPARQPQELLSLNNGKSVDYSYPNYKDIRDRNDVLSGLAALRFNPMGISIGNGSNLRLWGYEVTGNYFAMLGIKPLIGHFFHEDDDASRGSNPVVVLSYACWRSHFGGDPHIAGRKIKLNGYPFTVIGVAKPGFTGTELIINPAMWVPLGMVARVEPGNSWLDDRGTDNLWLLGRLKAGISRQQAQASLLRVARQLAREYPSINEGLKIDLYPPGLVGGFFRGPIANFAAILMAIAALVLLLACINLAGLLLARSSDRRKEIAVRLAIGAHRSQLLRQLFIESLTLAIAGAVSGVLIAFAIMHALSLWHPPFDIPANTSFTVDLRVLLFTGALAILATLLFGLAPAWQSTKVDLVPALKNELTFKRLKRVTMRDVLVTAQIAVSMILLVASLLVVRSLQNSMNVKLGFRPANGVSVSFALGLQGYDEGRGRSFQRELLQRAKQLPGLDAVGLISNVPLRLGEDDNTITIPGQAKLPVARLPWARIFSVSTGYLRAAGTRLVSGRDVSDRDGAGSTPVALINQTFARKLLAGKDPVGQRFRIGSNEKSPVIEIVGVVEDGKYGSLGEDPTLAVFRPMAQRYSDWTTLVARSNLPADEAIGSLRHVVAGMDNEMPLFNVGSLQDQLSLALFPARFSAVILGAFGALAIVIAAIGIFALVAYAVARRSREIGIRMALGARTGQVLGSVLSRTLVLCVCGAAAGLSIAFFFAQFLSALLYGISPHDGLSYGFALAMIGAVTVLACWYPSYRAIHIDPSNTLREQ